MKNVGEITVPIRTEVIEGKTLDRIASALERIADTLEKQDAGGSINATMTVDSLATRFIDHLQKASLKLTE